MNDRTKQTIEWYQHGLALLVCNAFCLFAAYYVAKQMPGLVLALLCIAQVFFIWAIVATVRFRHLDPWYQNFVPALLGISLCIGNIVGIFMLLRIIS